MLFCATVCAPPLSRCADILKRPDCGRVRRQPLPGKNPGTVPNAIGYRTQPGRCRVIFPFISYNILFAFLTGADL
jgi:hypothetical protein